MRVFFEGLFLVIFVHSSFANLDKLSESGSLDLDIDLERLQNGQPSPSSYEPPKRFIQSCDEARTSGVYELRLSSKSTPFRAFCDVESLYGKWLVFQQRLDGSVDFNRSWAEYRDGFGIVGESTEYWLGLELIHQITSSGDFELAIELKNEDGEYGFIRYELFEIEGKSDKYRIRSTSTLLHKGTINDYLKFEQFSTSNYYYNSCKSLGGWWYSSGCESSLNDQFTPNPNTGKGIRWGRWTEAATFSRMMIRRKPAKTICITEN